MKNETLVGPWIIMAKTEQREYAPTDIVDLTRMLQSSGPIAESTSPVERNVE